MKRLRSKGKQRINRAASNSRDVSKNMDASNSRDASNRRDTRNGWDASNKSYASKIRTLTKAEMPTLNSMDAKTKMRHLSTTRTACSYASNGVDANFIFFYEICELLSGNKRYLIPTCLTFSMLRESMARYPALTSPRSRPSSMSAW